MKYPFGNSLLMKTFISKIREVSLSKPKLDIINIT